MLETDRAFLHTAQAKQAKRYHFIQLGGNGQAELVAVVQRDDGIVDAHLNVALLPHLGSATIETRDAMGHRCLDNLYAVLVEGKPAPHAVR